MASKHECTQSFFLCPMIPVSGEIALISSSSVPSSFTLRRRVPSDHVLEVLINSLSGHPKYKQIVDRYYANLTQIELRSLEDRYESVQSAISELWVSSEKNPSLFKDTKDFESILQRKGLPYRDHFIHSFNVFLLGFW